jgi:ribose transport system substrate-binding protein
MNRRQARIHLIVICSLVIFFLAVGAIVHTAMAAEKKPVVAYLLPNVGPWYTDKWYGAQQEAQKHGIEAVMYNAGGYKNLNKQINQVEDLIQKKVDGIILHPVSPEGMIPVVEKALKAGIHVSTEHAPLAKKLVPHIWEAPSEAGRQLAMLLSIAVGGKGKIAAITGPPGQAEAQTMWDGFTYYIQNFPNIKVVDPAPAYLQYNVGEGLKQTEDFLTANPDLAGIYTWAELVAHGAVQALKARGFKPGQVKVVTAFISPETLGYMKDGWIQYSLPGAAVEVGRVSMRNMAKMLKGEKLPPGNYDVPMFAIGTEMIDKFDRSKWERPQ